MARDSYGNPWMWHSWMTVTWPSQMPIITVSSVCLAPMVTPYVHWGGELWTSGEWHVLAVATWLSRMLTIVRYISTPRTVIPPSTPGVRTCLWGHVGLLRIKMVSSLCRTPMLIVSQFTTPMGDVYASLTLVPPTPAPCQWLWINVDGS